MCLHVRALQKGPHIFLTRKPQAMLVDEKSTSVETVKKNLLLLQ